MHVGASSHSTAMISYLKIASSSGSASSTLCSEFIVQFSCEIVSNSFTAAGESSITRRYQEAKLFEPRSRARLFFSFLEFEGVDYVKRVDERILVRHVYVIQLGWMYGSCKCISSILA